MKFIKCWRWFGPEDAVRLEELHQAGIEGIVTSLLQVPVGDTWSLEAIHQRIREINGNGSFPFQWKVVESVNVHAAIKAGLPERTKLVKNYQQTIRNLASAGIKVICYNFMPVLDWVRTHYAHKLPDGRETIRLDQRYLALFDVFLLQREGAEDDYSAGLMNSAREILAGISDEERIKLERTMMGKLPGTNQTYSLEEFRAELKTWKEIDQTRYLEHLDWFLQQVIPVADSEGVSMAIHPDDPPFPVFGLPRIVSTEEDISTILGMHASKAHGITFCSGSLGVNRDTDLVHIIRKFGNRIHFLHLRNIRREPDGSFQEADHLYGDVDMVAVMEALVAEQQRRIQAGEDPDLPLRPDHGFRMIDDFKRVTYPGYALTGRLVGLAQLEGLAMAVRSKLTIDFE